MWVANATSYFQCFSSNPQDSFILMELVLKMRFIIRCAVPFVKEICFLATKIANTMALLILLLANKYAKNALRSI